MKAKASLSSPKAEACVYGFRPVAVVYVHREDRTSVDVVGGLLVRRSSFVVRRSSFCTSAMRAGRSRPVIDGHGSLEPTVPEGPCSKRATTIPTAIPSTMRCD